MFTKNEHAKLVNIFILYKSIMSQLAHRLIDRLAN